MKKTVLLLFITLGLWGDEILLDEHFQTLAAWQSVKFEKIDRLSTYSVSSEGLVLASQDSASALRLKGSYDVLVYPMVSVQWRVSVCDIAGDSRLKSGDDAPLRLYVAWEYDPESSPWFERLVYRALKLFYGEYPPRAVLNYIVSPKEMQEPFFKSPYTDKVMILPVQSCEKTLGVWSGHTFNVVADYQKVFGTMPQGKATLGIMADSDNTHGSSLASIATIQIHSALSKAE